MYTAGVNAAENGIMAAGTAEDNAIANVKSEASAAYASTAGAISSAATTTEEYFKIILVLAFLAAGAYLLAQVNLLRGK